jgi:hypothetical protein
MAEPLQPARRLTDRPDPDGWSAADVLDDERVDDDFIAADVSDLRTATRAYDPLQPEDERLFPPVAD